LLLTPTLTAPPLPLGHFVPDPGDPITVGIRAAQLAAFTSPFNLTGQPAISLPLHWGTGELPSGGQLVAAYGRDDLHIRGAGHAARQAERAQGDALVELDVVPEHARLADHDARAVVDEERLADLGAGVYVDAGVRVRVLRHDARQHGHALAVELVRDAVGGDGLDRRVAEDDLFDAVSGGIALEGGDYVLGEERADCGHLAQERERHGLGPVGVVRHARA